MKKPFILLAYSIAALFPCRECFANEAAPAEQEFLTFANQLPVDDQGWVQLSPYGDFPNVDKAGKPVIQRFQRADAEAIVNEFKSLANLPQRLLGLPWYVGHPDHPRFKGQPGHTDTAAKGRIKALEAREDGLYANVKFNSAGRQLVEDEAFHGHSVNWHATPAGTEGGKTIFRPGGLKSVGFTNQPQIPVKPATLANEDLVNAVPPKLLLLAGFKEDDETTTMEQVIAKLSTMMANEKTVAGFPVKLDPKQPALEIRLVNEADVAPVNNLVHGLEGARTALANERKARAILVVEPLIKAGKIVIAEKDAKIEALCNAGDKFDEMAITLANGKVLVKTVATTKDLGRQNVELQTDVRARQAKHEALMAKREQEFPNESYDARFKAVSESPEGAQLFAQMQRAGGAE